MLAPRRLTTPRRLNPDPPHTRASNGTARFFLYYAHQKKKRAVRQCRRTAPSKRHHRAPNGNITVNGTIAGTGPVDS